MGIFRGFCVLGEGVSPKWHVKVCLVFLTGNFRRFSPNDVGGYKLPYLIRWVLKGCWELLVDGEAGLDYNYKKG